MAGGLSVQVRQLASFPAASSATPGDILLMQSGGLGGPYATITPQALVGTALAASSTPLQAPLIETNSITLSPGDAVSWSGGGWDAQLTSQISVGYQFSLNGIVQMILNPAGGLSLPFGTLTVARSPASANEVATMGWVGASTTTSWNGRRGAVSLQPRDLEAVLGFPLDCLATVPQVNQIVCSAIQDLIHTYPSVWSFNGRVGDVWLTAADINWALANADIPLLVPNPPTVDPPPGQVVNVEWVQNYVASVLAGPPAYATEPWVLQQIQGIQVGVSSFNGRQGAVLLTLADVTQVGGAPAASPTFSGYVSVPTAAPGTDDAQAASTAFVMAAISSQTAGVATWNGRSGAVTMNVNDITTAGGAPLASPVLTGTPQAPTAAANTATTQIATTAFVTSAIGAIPVGVSSFNTRTGAVTFQAADITGVGGALLASPAFTGNPTAPTPATGNNSTSIATTAFVMAELAALSPGVASFNGRTGAVSLTTNDISAAGGLVNPSVNLTGNPTAPTPAPGDNSQSIATTAFVDAAISAIGAGVSSFNTRTGAVTLSAADITGAGGALLASPTFTGVPAAPTATAGTNTTQLATTAFVQAAISSLTSVVSSFNGRQGAVTLTTADITGAGGAPAASPALTGTPTAPTATAGTSTTQIATTAFVQNALASTWVQSFNTRTGAVTLTLNDVTAVGGAPLASPSFTGTPAAPTATPGTSTTQLATTAFVTAAIAAIPSTNAVLLQATTPGTAQTGNFNISGTGIVGTQLTLPAGTAAAPSLVVGGTAGTGIYSAGAGGMNLAAGGVNAVSITSTIVGLSGNFLVTGTSQLTGPVTILGATNTANISASGNVSTTASMITTELLVPGGGYINNGGTTGAIQMATVNNWLFIIRNVDPIWYWGPATGPAMQLASNGNLSITGTLSQGSDETTKNSIAAYAPGVSAAAQLLPKTFIYNNDTTNAQHLGFIAQDVQPVIPTAVISSTYENAQQQEVTTLSLDYNAIVAVAINAIKQLISRVQALESNANITPTAAEVA